MRIVSGNYTGNGTSQSVTGLTAKPLMVWIKAKSGTLAAMGTTSAHPADETKYLAETTDAVAGAITSLNADGFSVGAALTVNTNAVVFDWLAWLPGGGVDAASGTYTGNGTTLSVTGLAFAPDIVITFPGIGTLQRAWFATKESIPGTTPSGFTSMPLGAAAGITNGITALGAAGFTVGNAASVNTNAVLFYYLAFKVVPGLVKSGYYDGTGLDDVTISGVGFTPENGWIKNAEQTAASAWRSKSMSGDQSSNFTTGNIAANNIQAFGVDTFQVGTGASNTVDRDYFWVMTKDGVSSAGGGPGNSGNAPGRGHGNPTPGNGGGGAGGGGGSGGGVGTQLHKAFWGRRRRTR